MLSVLKNRLDDAVLFSNQNACLEFWIKTIFAMLSSKMLHISSNVYVMHVRMFYMMHAQCGQSPRFPGIYLIGEQERSRRVCTYAQTS